MPYASRCHDAGRAGLAGSAIRADGSCASLEVPKSTPTPIIDRLTSACDGTLHVAEWHKTPRSSGVPVHRGSGADSARIEPLTSKRETRLDSSNRMDPCAGPLHRLRFASCSATPQLILEPAGRGQGLERHEYDVAYRERGSRVPVVFVFGSGVDYRYFAAQVEPFATAGPRALPSDCAVTTRSPIEVRVSSACANRCRIWWR